LKKNNYLNEPEAEHLGAEDDYKEFLTDLPDIENTQSHRQEVAVGMAAANPFAGGGGLAERGIQRGSALPSGG
jgi:hypothetical protein